MNSKLLLLSFLTILSCTNNVNQEGNTVSEIEFPSFLKNKIINPYGCFISDNEGDLSFYESDGSIRISGDHWGGIIEKSFYEKKELGENFYITYKWFSEENPDGIQDTLSIRLETTNNENSLSKKNLFLVNDNNKIKQFCCENGDESILIEFNPKFIR